MTTRSTHVVVDGSNIATEGRAMPSLAQLNEAVLAYRAEHPGVTITVVVDATFGHRIPKSETAEFDEAIANNELVAPPAGAVGRGDAFVLGIANKARATVLSNDSFQEFHGQYEWLFDEGRLVGGKPVPHVGWVFVERSPVRGPVSRKAVRDSKRTPSTAGRRARGHAAAGDGAAATPVKRASREASRPMPVPTAPPPGRAVPADGVNELMPFLEFVERHPVGTSVNAIVDSYSSHGAYVRVGDVKGYVPLRLMGEPPPRSARDAMKVGDAVTLVVASFAPARRSVDLAMPHTAVAAGAPGADVAVEAIVDAVSAPAGTRRSRKRAATAAEARPSEPLAAATAEGTAATAKRAGAKKVVASQAEVASQAGTRATAGRRRSAAPATAERAARDVAATAPSVPREPATIEAPLPTPEEPAPAQVVRADTRRATAKKATATRKAAAKEPPTTPAATEPAAAKRAPAKRAATKASAAATGPAKASVPNAAATDAPSATGRAPRATGTKATKATGTKATTATKATGTKATGTKATGKKVVGKKAAAGGVTSA